MDKSVLSLRAPSYPTLPQPARHIHVASGGTRIIKVGLERQRSIMLFSFKVGSESPCFRNKFWTPTLLIYKRGRLAEREGSKDT